MFLHSENMSAATAFVNSPLWADFKRCLLDRHMPEPEPEDALHTQAAKGFGRVGYETAIANFEKIARELPPPDVKSPFDRPAVTAIED
jgi:hypothetical protein